MYDQPPPLSQPFPLPISVAATPPLRDYPAAATNEDSSAGPSPLTHAMVNNESTAGGDGPSVDVVRRPRGRPPGSKNKPKPTAAAESAMSSYVLEISGGSDIVEMISRFCRHRNIGLCILNAEGIVSNVTLRQPSSSTQATVTFHGRYDILSFSATFVPHSTSFTIPNGFAVTLVGPQGHIFGGLVAGELIGDGTVNVLAVSFNNPSYQRLPMEGEIRRLAFSDVQEGQSPPIAGENAAVATGGLLPNYGTQSSPEEVWTYSTR